MILFPVEASSAHFRKTPFIEREKDGVSTEIFAIPIPKISVGTPLQ